MSFKSWRIRYLNKLMTVIICLQNVMAQLPLVPTVYPAGGCQTYLTSIYSNPGTGIANYTSTVAFATSLPYTVNPYVFAGLWDLSWQSNLNFSLDISSISTTSAIISMNLGAQISLLKANIITIDSQLYGLTVFRYSVGPMAGTFQISNHSQYPVVIMNRYEGVGMLSGQPKLQILQYLSSKSTRVSLQIDTPYQLLALSLTMFRVDTATLPASDLIYGLILPLSSNSNASLWSNVRYYTLYQPTYYFAGIHLFFNAHASLSKTFSISNMAITNMQGYFSQFIMSVKYCPPLFPYYNASSQLCYIQCGTGFYANIYQACQPCSPNCLDCINQNSNCSACPTPLQNLELHSINGSVSFQCVCTEGTYISSNVSTPCIYCNATFEYCLSCGNDTVCDQCIFTFYFNATTKKCECLVGHIVTTSGIPRCVTGSIKQQCSAGTQVSLLKPYSCSCPPAALFILGICISI